MDVHDVAGLQVYDLTKPGHVLALGSSLGDVLGDVPGSLHGRVERFPVHDAPEASGQRKLLHSGRVNPAAHREREQDVQVKSAPYLDLDRTEVAGTRREPRESQPHHVPSRAGRRIPAGKRAGESAAARTTASTMPDRPAPMIVHTRRSQGQEDQRLTRQGHPVMSYPKNVLAAPFGAGGAVGVGIARTAGSREMSATPALEQQRCTARSFMGQLRQTPSPPSKPNSASSVQRPNNSHPVIRAGRRWRVLLPERLRLMQTG